MLDEPTEFTFTCYKKLSNINYAAGLKFDSTQFIDKMVTNNGKYWIKLRLYHILNEERQFYQLKAININGRVEAWQRKNIINSKIHSRPYVNYNFKKPLEVYRMVCLYVSEPKYKVYSPFVCLFQHHTKTTERIQTNFTLFKSLLINLKTESLCFIRIGGTEPELLHKN